MNQKDLVDSLAKHFYFTKAESSRVVDFILDKISIDLQKGNRVYFRGFGSFVKQSLDSKRVRHPKTGKMIATKDYFLRFSLRDTFVLD